MCCIIMLVVSFGLVDMDLCTNDCNCSFSCSVSMQEDAAKKQQEDASAKRREGTEEA